MTNARSSPPPLRVRVPASTSNLGPGFDLLGLALSLWLEVRCDRGEVADGGAGSTRVEHAGPGACDWSADGDWVLRAFERGRGLWGPEASSAFDVERLTTRLRVRSEIPVGRGFGSSGAAVVAGLLLARATLGETAANVPDAELLREAVHLEGHPDNATAALLGGCTLGLPRDDGPPVVVRNALAPELGFALAWPRLPLDTPRARALLPRKVPFADAVENPRRLALLLEGLRTGDPRLLELGGHDRLHTPYRLPHIPGAAEALSAARAAGAWLTALSGAGSGLVAIGPRAAMADVAERMAATLRATDPQGFGEARVVEPVTGSPRVERLPPDAD